MSKTLYVLTFNSHILNFILGYQKHTKNHVYWTFYIHNFYFKYFKLHIRISKTFASCALFFLHSLSQFTYWKLHNWLPDTLRSCIQKLCRSLNFQFIYFKYHISEFQKLQNHFYIVYLQNNFNARSETQEGNYWINYTPIWNVSTSTFR